MASRPVGEVAFPDPDGHGARVLQRCADGRFPWAHSYVNRLVADAPDDPFPRLLRAALHAHCGEAAACRTALADALGAVTGHPELRRQIAEMPVEGPEPMDHGRPRGTLHDHWLCRGDAAAA
jgi:hypothetical protein